MQLWVKTPASLSEKGGLVGIALINEWATKVYGLVNSYMAYLLFVIQVSFLSVLWAHAQLWLKQLDLFLYSIWDKVIAGSCMILVYVAVAVLLSVRRKILGLQTREEILHLLNKVI